MITLSDWLGIIGLILGVISIGVSLWLFYAKISVQLDILILRKTRPLNYPEAVSIVNLYLDAAQGKLQAAIREFVELQLPRAIRDGNVTSSYNIIFGKTDDIIRKLRSDLYPFRLIGHVTLQEFLDKVNPIHSGNIDEAKKNIEAAAQRAIGNHLNAQSEEDSLIKFAIIAKQRSHDLIISELRKLYKPTD